MEIGIDSFAAKFDEKSNDTDADALEKLLDRIEYADKMGLHSFGIGEHHRIEFLDSAPVMILAGEKTKKPVNH